MSTVSELLDNHVTLTIESLDRIYLNGYIPSLQTAGQLVSFLTVHRGHPIPSPALLKKIDREFESSLDAFAEANDLVRVKFERNQRKDDIAAVHRARFTASEGVYLLGVAQEKCNSFRGATSRDENTNFVSVGFSRQSAFVSHYYYYLLDSDFGPAFIKVSTYAPYGLRICINGHEWAKRQLEKEGIAYESLDNGFKSCANPERLQQICNSLGQKQILDFLDKWLARLPLPLTNADRAAGYNYLLSLWQIEVSRTQVFDAPVHGREFFEEVIRENLDLGRPDRVSLVFDRQIVKSTPGIFRTRVFEDGVHPSLHIEYKSCHVKQYFKENWALRTETTINNPADFYVGKLLSNLDKLRTIGRDINLRLLDVQRISQACTLTQSTVENITHPTVTQDGQRVPALRFGDPRPMALWSALTLMCTLPQGFDNASLREHVGDLLGPDTAYRANQMTYDLRRLKRKDLIERLPKTHRYRVTALGLKAALFFSKLHARLFKPASASLADIAPNAPSQLREAFTQVKLAIEQLVEQAKLEAAC